MPFSSEIIQFKFFVAFGKDNKLFFETEDELVALCVQEMGLQQPFLAENLILKS